MRVILIYELVPDDLVIYDLILDDSGNDLTKLRACHGKRGNSAAESDEHLVNDWLPKWLEDKKGDIVYQANDASKLTPPLDLSTGDYVEKGTKFRTKVELIVSGFLL